MYEYNTGIYQKTVQPNSESVVISVPPQETNDVKIAAQEVTNNCQTGVKTSTEQQLEYLLSNLLKYGVLLASAFVLLGGILYLIHHGSEPADYHIFHGTPSEFCSPVGVFGAVLSGSRRGIIQLGMLLLIATPIFRVIISLLTFLLKREFIYVIITSLVLASLTYSLIGAYF
ncbi:DUF1634 domain-containing protein [Anabaena azotica]|uniref:DUF1634 domain-containing protein n=1 Tax=Anabaena azotica FACHB-119 TaxID=947527 RepID=A0ABR8D8V2_9NOST|nr:DUF1634 domain-containing protein [Anabaena azotica]MBD2502642.1 DUF1634 domain-containing protein [Anabaena azotica FACHB-119]